MTVAVEAELTVGVEGAAAAVMVYPVWPDPTATVSPLVSKLKVIAAPTTYGFAPRLVVQVRTTAEAAAQAALRVEVRIVFVPVTVDVVTLAVVPAQVAPHSVKPVVPGWATAPASAAQIA